MSFVDPGSGFPNNPGRHQAAPFTSYKEDIAEIEAATDKRLEEIRNSDRRGAADTLTSSYVNKLMEAGVLPGSEGYVSPQEKSAARRAAMNDPLDPGAEARRRENVVANLEVVRENAATRREQDDKDLLDRMSAIRELNAANRRVKVDLGTRPGYPADFEFTPIGVPPAEETAPSLKGLNLPDLPTKSKLKGIEGPKLFNKEGGEKTLKKEADLFDWYQSKGGEMGLKEAIKQAGYEDYDSKKDARLLADIFTKDLRQTGKKEMQGFNKAMNKIDKMFDGKFTFKTYRQALEGNSASDVNDWIKNYIELGGGVGRKVMDRIGI